MGKVRRTPPVDKQVIDPYLKSNALLKARLIDFDTGSAELEAQHRVWLAPAIMRAMGNSMYRIRLVGYASKLGSADANLSLSYQRIKAVQNYLQSFDTNAIDRTETFTYVGSGAYEAGATDDSANYRAVEVHIFIGDIPPPPPEPVKPVIIRHDLPEGPRFTEWEVAAPGGVFIAEGGGIGFNIFFIKNTKTTEFRGYIQPVIGVGGSISIPGLKLFWNMIQQAVTGLQATNMDFTPVKSNLPVNWKEMEDSLVRVASAGAGVVRGFAIGTVTFTAAGVWQFNEFGNPVKLPGGELFHFDSTGKDWQLGVGASEAVGPLVRVGN